MNNSKIEEFHIPFIKSLVFVAMMTVVSMVSVRYFINYSLSNHINTPQYTSQHSESPQK